MPVFAAQAGTVQFGITQAGNQSVWASTPTSQQGIPTSVFTGLGPSLTINAISFLAGQAGSFNPLAVWTLSIGTKLNANATWSGSLAANLPSPVVFETKSFTTPFSAGDLITFNGSYVYTPAAGDLVLQESIVGTAGGPAMQWGNTGIGPISCLLYNSGSPACGAGYGLTTIFTYNEAVTETPEPAALAVLSMALTALAGLRMRRRRG